MSYYSHWDLDFESTKGNGCPWTSLEGFEAGHFRSAFLAIPLLFILLCDDFFMLGFMSVPCRVNPLISLLLFWSMKQWAMCFLDDHMKIQSIFRAILLPGIIYGTFDLNGGLYDDVNAWNGYLKILFTDLMFNRLTPLMQLHLKEALYFLSILYFWLMSLGTSRQTPQLWFQSPKWAINRCK